MDRSFNGVSPESSDGPSKPSKPGTARLERRERQARHEPVSVPSNLLCGVKKSD